MSAEAFIPPQNLEAEQAILEACLVDDNAIGRIRELQPDDFYLGRHRDIFRAMLDLQSAGKPVDLITLGVECPGHVAEIDRMAASAFTAANVQHHARIVKDLAMRRKLVNGCRETIVAALDQGNSLDETLSLLRARTHEIVSGHGGEMMSLKDIVKMTFKRIEEREQNPDRLSGITSGFRDIDRLTDGWQGGDSIIVAGRPGTGKSAWAMTTGFNSGVPVGVISLEMGPFQLGIRLLSSLSQVDLWRLRKGFIRDAWGVLTQAAATMAEREMYFSFASRNVAQVEKIITQMVERHGIKLLIVDYLQLMKSVTDKKREQEVAEVSRLLKAMALTHDIPVISLAQLNRAMEKEKRKPVLSDLRESGQIEQDADIVIFLYQEAKDDGLLQVDFAKGRNLELGNVKLVFDKGRMTFRDYDEQHSRGGYQADDDTF